MNDQIYNFMVNYLGYELDFISDKKILEMIEGMYNSGKHPKVEQFVDMNKDLFEEVE